MNRCIVCGNRADLCTCAADAARENLRKLREGASPQARRLLDAETIVRRFAHSEPYYSDDMTGSDECAVCGWDHAIRTDGPCAAHEPGCLWLAARAYCEYHGLDTLPDPVDVLATSAVVTHVIPATVLEDQ